LPYTPLIVLASNEDMVTAMTAMVNRGFPRAAIVKEGHLVGMLNQDIAKKALKL
jgi:CBS domain-containing protein